MCGVNETNRFIVCCSQRDYCNDLDAYSKEIRQALLSPHSTSKCLDKKNNKILILNICFSSTSTAW